MERSNPPQRPAGRPPWQPSSRRSLRRALLLLVVLALACDVPLRPRSERSFAEIAASVAAMNGAEIAALLGEPDSRQPVFLRDERWIWWNYTYLAGEDCPPEMRGQVVHLEILLHNPAEESDAPSSYRDWRISQPAGVTYRIPGEVPPVGAFGAGL
ncbi:MAG TPA: hypothetical protein VHQ65_00455 [Thermoanaerobaculia bacterium]|nr:hypothetical protein [Thermoanaerobaculia bacterium]